MNALSWKKLVLSFVLGALLVSAFAPFNVYPLAFISLAGLFYLWRDTAPKASFLIGLSYGYGLYGVGVSWVYVSLSTYGGMPLWMGILAVLGFTGLLALFVALTGYVVARYFPNNRLLAIPFIWVVFEWGKSWVLTGFPWLDVAYTQTESWLMYWAPIGGVYLVSFVSIVLAACLSASIQVRTYTKRIFLGLTAFGLLLLSNFMSFLEWSQPVGEPLSVGVVQPNTPIDIKWQRSYQTELIGKLASLSNRLNVPSNKPVDLIVWPETALPLYVQQTSADFWRSVTPLGSALLTGIMDRPNSNDSNEIYNAAVLNCDGQLPTVYRKSHLVPFGEYLPLRFLFNWVLEYLELPMSDLSSWRGTQTLSCGDNISVGLSICYEDAFANEYRKTVGDATMLVNISEDAWFGDSLAPHQRMQMAQMRAAELARPLVRSANSGPSMLIGVQGRVLNQTAQFSVESAVFTVQPHEGDTPFKRFGNWLVYLALLILSVSIVLRLFGLKR